MRKFLRDERGQDLAEYGIALAVIAVGSALIAHAIGVDISALWDNAHEVLHSVSGGNH